MIFPMKKIFLLLLFPFFSTSVFAQEFEAELQIRPRYEFRNGYKTLLYEDQEPAHFISQRSRLNLNFKDEALAVKFSLQNVNVWGDTPISTASGRNDVMVFEAYGAYTFNEDLAVRLGRQQMAYDNQRILGAPNWGQQGQSHDAALILWEPKENQQLHLGVAFNAETESLADVPYLADSYRSLQFLWHHFDFTNSGISFLAMNTGYEELIEDDFETQYLQTFGSFFNFEKNKFYADAAVYGQVGKRNQQDLSAFYAGVNVGYGFSPNWSAKLGAEYFSGTNMDETEELHSFTPLFGANHGFNGAMDYFFAGNHINSVGLLDNYLHLTFRRGEFAFSATPHVFHSAAENQDHEKYLGSEIDLMAAYSVREDFVISFGFSQMFGTESLEALKLGNAETTQNWAWLMVSFHPEIFSFPKNEEKPDL